MAGAAEEDAWDAEPRQGRSAAASGTASCTESAGAAPAFSGRMESAGAASVAGAGGLSPGTRRLSGYGGGTVATSCVACVSRSKVEAAEAGAALGQAGAASGKGGGAGACCMALIPRAWNIVPSPAQSAQAPGLAK